MADAHNLGSALAAFVRRGASVASVVDVGASDGRWSRQVAKHLPHARFHMVEAMEHHRAGLEAACAANPRCSYVLAAAGPRVGEVFFEKTVDPFGGAAVDADAAAAGAAGGAGGRLVRVPMTTVDHEVARLGLVAPYFVKLDTHGFEVEILTGAAETLSRASLVQLEVYNFNLRPGSLRFAAMCGWMEERGLRCSAVFDLMTRPGDGALWQFDAFFEPAGAGVFGSDAYA